MPLLFWISLFSIFYAYLGYHILLCLLFLIRPQTVQKRDIQPSVSLVLAVYNEEGSIEKKLQNCLDLEYPEHLLDIVLVSDGATDRTNALLKDWSQKHPRLKVHFMEQNIGKTPCLNHVLPNLRGEIILLTDANAWLPQQTLDALLPAFADPQVGLVTGSTHYVAPEVKDAPHSHGISIYTRLEQLAKTLETMTGSCVGADGALFALRRSLFSPLDSEDINDFVLPLRVVRAGYRAVYVQEAICLESTAGDMSSEFHRQQRITTRTLQALRRNKDLLNPLAFPLFALKLISHKLMKFLTPLFLIIALGTNLVLIPESLLYAGLFSMQLALYSLALLGYIQDRKNRDFSVSRLPYSFVTTNAAMLWGWFRFLSGHRTVTWKPER
ncbi:MAG: glycosyltransferase family 2 protein [Desulfohalobiaceae bacterium]|nr:glycosyltransferase family 2 protein [Desulfohalobiaceae bacterium]